MKVKGSDVPNIPPARIGLHRGVCAEIVDRGIVDTQHGKKHKGWIIFQVEELIDLPDTDYHGKRKELRISFNLTLAKRSTLRQVLESWRGMPLSPEEIQDGFELDDLMGVCALLNVGSHSEPDELGRVFANIASVLPPVGEDGKTGDSWSIELSEYIPVAERGPQLGEPGTVDDGKGGKVPF